MDLKLWLLILGGALLLAALLNGLAYSFSGVWERMDNISRIASRERIRLAQVGFIVLGNRTVVGGQQSFFGLAFGPNIWLRRRDFGLPFLESEGFPREIANQVEGQISAKYRLELSKDRNFLNGVFISYRVEFSVDPPSVTAMHPQAPVARKYRRVEIILEKEIATAISSAD